HVDIPFPGAFAIGGDGDVEGFHPQRNATPPGLFAQVGGLPGAGIAQAFIRERVAADLAAGRLVEVLPGSCLPLPPMWLYYLNRRHVPAKLRAFIELLREWRQPA
ncbi:LysR substrate-binding domain-containing protein, partial [Pseudomonas aeruginosa]|uniref:LysR substrate-binding domain-containing protein n=1 Tax=Pseudomonas aeruginosa TaxID=287 RepID=UPI00300104AD